ncbi:unnamed protein product, partial [Meganyctiphanes norvegica]
SMVGEESADTIHLASFLTITKKLISDRRFGASSKEELKRALLVLARDGPGYMLDAHPDKQAAKDMFGEGKKRKNIPPNALIRNHLIKLLMSEGEPLTREEAEELMLTLPVQDVDIVDQESYIDQLLPAPKFL